MIKISPLNMIFLGAALLMLGVLLPLFMVIKILPSTFWLSFLSYTASVVGMFVGLIGALTFARNKKKG